MTNEYAPTPELAPMRPSDQAETAQGLNRTALIELIEDHLTSVYHCTRVWAAWQFGTMTEDDFVEARGTDLAPDIADAVLSLTATPVQEMAQAGLGAPGQRVASEGYEHYAAIREGHRNAAEEAWFTAIPNIDPRRAFQAGFDAGYNTRDEAIARATKEQP